MSTNKKNNTGTTTSKKTVTITIKNDKVTVSDGRLTASATLQQLAEKYKAYFIYDVRQKFSEGEHTFEEVFVPKVEKTPEEKAAEKAAKAAAEKAAAVNAARKEDREKMASVLAASGHSPEQIEAILAQLG